MVSSHRDIYTFSYFIKSNCITSKTAANWSCSEAYVQGHPFLKTSQEYTGGRVVILVSLKVVYSYQTFGYLPKTLTIPRYHRLWR